MPSMPYSCPRCHLTCNAMSDLNMSFICSHCGWTHNAKTEAAEVSRENRYAFKIFFVGLMVFAFLAHVSIWKDSASAIIPLQIKYFLDLSTKDDLLAQENICKNKKRKQCLMDVYRSLTESYTDLAQPAAELGHIYWQQKRFKPAQEYYQLHFKRKGQDAKAAYHLARLFDSQQKTQNAVKFYEKALALNPNKIQPELIKDYVTLLVGMKRKKEARRVIESVRNRRAVLRYFMAKEYNSLK